MRVPPGYRFVPTDYELIKHYLLNKINHRPNLIQQIQKVDLYDYDPPTLAETYPKLGDNDWYFFTSTNRKYPKGNRPSRSAGNGFWKATGREQKVYEGDDVIGKRRTLVYYIGTYHDKVKTDWIMHEYRACHAPRARTHANDMQLDDWVLCRMYKNVNLKVKGVEPVQETNVVEGEQGLSISGGGRERGDGSGSSSDGDREITEEANGPGAAVNDEDSYWESLEINALLQDHSVVPSLGF